jgi:hypothetical protein
MAMYDCNSNYSGGRGRRITGPGQSRPKKKKKEKQELKAKLDKVSN